MVESVELIIRQPGHPDRVVRLPEGTTRFGRAEDNDIVLSDVGVSRRHARVIVSRDKVRIEDLGSGNGTYYRGFRIQTQVLEDADEVVIDPFVLSFRIKGDQPANAALDLGSAPARLDVVAGQGMAHKAYPIGPRGLTLGRSENRDVVIPDPAASRHHCTILPRGSDFILRDMGSANGVFVNSVRVRESLLASGDRVRIGNTELRFVLASNGSTDSTTHKRLEPVGSFPPPDTGPRTGGGRGARWLPIVLGSVTVAALVALVFVSIAGIAVGYIWTRPSSPVPVSPPEPPSFTLVLPGGLPEATVDELFAQGTDAIRNKENRTALEAFYRALNTDPGNAGAERLMYVAGEFVVLDSLEASLQEANAARVTREAERDRLLESRRRRSSQAALEQDFREDRVVIDTMEWDLGPEGQAAQALLDEAAAYEAEEQWSQAAHAYDQVLRTSRDPELRKAAQARFRVARHEAARRLEPEWRAGVEAAAAGDTAGARAHLEAVLAADPDHVPARLHLEALSGS